MAETLDFNAQRASESPEAPEIGEKIEASISEALPCVTKESPETEKTLLSDTVEKKKKMENSFRAVIDTSPPFESVKEAVSRFGGSGVWKPQHKFKGVEHRFKEVDIVKVEEQAAQLEKDLILKERETLNVLKELETTKRVMEDLKSRLQKEASEGTASLECNSENSKTDPTLQVADVNVPEMAGIIETHQDSMAGITLYPTSTPSLILMELKQAKLNLNRTTNDISGIRSSVESLNKKIERERVLLEKTRERLTSNSSKIVSLEEELNQTRLKLKLAKDEEITSSSENPEAISKELHQLSSEAERFKKAAEAAKSEVLRATLEIEQIRASVKTAEIRWVAAKKMEEAARAAETVALTEIRALANSENLSGGGITLSFEEYSSLTRKAREAEEFSKKKIVDAMVKIDEANVSNMGILKKVEEATEEVKNSKKVLEEALNRVEAANKGKLAVEEALRKWRSDHGQRRRSSVHNSTKFKNPSHYRRDSRLFDMNGLNLLSDGPVLKPTLSIGQILSRKLLMPEEFEMEMKRENSAEKQKVSLAQMLSRRNAVLSPPELTEKEENVHKQFTAAKRKKFAFARFALLLTKQSKKKKKKRHAPRHGNAMCR